MAKQLPRGIRNFNPGNIERSKDRWLGMSPDQSSDSRFLVFDTAEAGIRALMRVLVNYQERHKINTLRSAINRWAPPGENNSNAYVQHVSRLTGFDPDEPLDFLDKEVNVALTRAIIRHENGEPTLYGKKEWYDDATYERAAVMAGFEPAVKPLSHSRTIAGATLATAGVAAGIITGTSDSPIPVTAEDVVAIGTIVSPLVGAQVLAWLNPLVALAGIGLTVYARWDDSRRKLR